MCKGCGLLLGDCILIDTHAFSVVHKSIANCLSTSYKNNYNTCTAYRKNFLIISSGTAGSSVEAVEARRIVKSCCVHAIKLDATKRTPNAM